MKILAPIALISITSAQASTDAAWRVSTRAGRAACIAASGLRTATASAPLNFSDAIGRDAILVRGTYPQAFTKGARGTMLCLYDRRTHKAEATEATGWMAPR